MIFPLDELFLNTLNEHIDIEIGLDPISDNGDVWKKKNGWAKINTLIFWFYFSNSNIESIFVCWGEEEIKQRWIINYLVACRLELPSSSSASGDGANDLVAFGVKLAVVRFVVVAVDICWSIFNSKRFKLNVFIQFWWGPNLFPTFPNPVAHTHNFILIIII